MTAGRLARLRRYPVKSMLGEDLDAVAVTERGLFGDRALAVVDGETGRVASAKHPRLWRALLAIAASGAPPETSLRFPDGAAVMTSDPGAGTRLAGFLGREVSLAEVPPPGATLQRAVPEEVLLHGVDAEVAVQESRIGGVAPPGTFFDYAPVHLVTTSTLARLGELSPRGVIQAERYRPNLVVETDGVGFVEAAWAGRRLAVGAEVELEVLVSTPRCSVPTLAHGALPRDLDALRIPAAWSRVEIPGLGEVACVGVYARVARPGRVRRGDEVRLLGD